MRYAGIALGAVAFVAALVAGAGRVIERVRAGDSQGAIVQAALIGSALLVGLVLTLLVVWVTGRPFRLALARFRAQVGQGGVGLLLGETTFRWRTGAAVSDYYVALVTRANDLVIAHADGRRETVSGTEVRVMAFDRDSRSVSVATDDFELNGYVLTTRASGNPRVPSSHVAEVTSAMVKALRGRMTRGN